MIAVNGDIPCWRFHYDRLRRGLQALAIPLDNQILARQMRAVLASGMLVGEKVSADKERVIKLMVTRGEGGRGYQIPTRVNANLITTFSTMPSDRSMAKGVKVHYCQQPLFPQPLGGIKTLNQLVYVLASRERLGSCYNEGLLFNDRGQLIEATARNVFLVDSRMRLLTPKLDQCGVEGVMRRLVIDIIAPELNIAVEQTTITKTDIMNARELFLTNSVTHIWPVVDCGRRQWSRGSVTMAIQHRLAHFLQHEKRLCYSRHDAMNARALSQ